MSGQDGLRLAVALAITFLAAWIGSIASMGAGDFYQRLEVPGWAPPASVFGPVWTVLYALMAIALWLAWRNAGARAALPLTVYGIQLGLNALWSWLFFRWQLGAAAVVEIFLLWLAIVATVVVFSRFSRAAPWLLAPYLAWVTFAAALTVTLWRMNPGLL